MNLPEPYYQDDAVTIYHGDCRDVLPHIEADVMVTDPPYGTHVGAGNERGGYGRRQNHGNGRDGFTIDSDRDSGLRDAILAMWAPRPVAVFGSPRHPDPPGEWADRLVWDKRRPGMNGGPWRYRHETIYVTAGFLRTDDSAVSIIAAYPADQALHMHAKPLEVMRRIVGAAPPGVIVDPFAGSGSTLRAAKDLGRRAVGIEIDEHYCRIAADRMRQEALDLGGAA